MLAQSPSPHDGLAGLREARRTARHGERERARQPLSVNRVAALGRHVVACARHVLEWTWKNGVATGLVDPLHQVVTEHSQGIAGV